MIEAWKQVKLMVGLLVGVIILVFSVIGVMATWNDYVAKDYDTHLTETVYIDAAVNQNVNLVFYKLGCPYCQAGKKAVTSTAEDSPYPTFYINVETSEGQELVKQYHVEKAATIIQIRYGVAKEFSYAGKNQAGAIEVRMLQIEEALNE